MSESPAATAGHLFPEPVAAAPTRVRGGPRRIGPRLARAVPVLLAVAALASLLVAVDPRSVAAAAARFDLRLVLPLVALGAMFYLVQGLRWHLLLGAIGVRQTLADSQLINLAGQSVSAVLPLGDLTRALLVSASSGVEFGAAAATVTIQELSFSLLLVLAAVPGLGHLHDGAVWMLAVLAAMAAIVAILTVPGLFTAARGLLSSTPGLHRLLGQIDALQREVRHLLGRPDVVAGTVIELGRVIVATAGMVLILRGLHVTSLGWAETALVVAVSYVGGAVSVLPGGIGANEASVVGILVVLGVDPAAAAAAALLQRLWLSGLATTGGLLAYAAVRRRLHLAGRAGVRTLAASFRAEAARPTVDSEEELIAA